MALSDKLDSNQYDSVALRPTQREYLNGLLNKHLEAQHRSDELRNNFAEALKFVAADLGVSTEGTVLLPDLSAFVKQSAPSLQDMKIETKVN